MSSLDKMSVMGIRSFAPDVSQVIHFFSPLTLILGPNGSGKTTIIEALRYITTGDMPPNSNRGSAFIHDPKIAHEVEVKAQIKLKFVDVMGKVATTTRSMVATQKQKRLEVRSLDGTILRKNEDGKDVSISSKCAELDREMVASLGVSKAILNNVIFCHQEESNWPLNEGKALKTKFDEIFAATRYIKALDSLHKIRLEHDNDAKMFSSELKYLEDNKQKAAKLRSDREKSEIRLSMSQDRVKQVKEKLKPIEDSLEEINKKEHIIGRVQTELASKQAELNVMLKVCKDLESKIVNVFTGSDEKLKQELENFCQLLECRKDEKAVIDRDLKKISLEIPEISRERSSILLKLGKLRTEAEQHKERVASRDRIVRNLCLTYNIGNLPLTETNVGNVQKHLKDKIEFLLQEHKRIKGSFDEKDKAVQKELNVLRDTKAKLEQTEHFRTEQINDARKNIQSISAELFRVDAMTPKLQIVEVELEKKQKELSDLSEAVDVQRLQAELNGIRREISDLECNIRQLDDELMKIHEQSQHRTELELLKKDKVAHSETIQKLKSKHEDAIVHLLGSMPKDKISDAVEKFKMELSREIQEMTKSRDKIQVDIATFKSNYDTSRKELQRKESELKDCEDKLFKTCGSRNLESSLSQLNTSIKNLHDERGAFTGTEYLYKKFINTLERQEPCCPLCHRNFNDSQDVEDLIDDLKMKLRLLPTEMESTQKSLQQQQDKYNSMLELKPVKSRVESLSNTEIPQLKAKVKIFGERFEEKERQIGQLEEMLMLKQSDESAAQSMQSDLVLLSQHTSEVKRIETRIEQICKILGRDSERTLPQVSSEKVELQKQLKALQSSLKKKEKQLSDHTQTVQGLQAEVNRLGADRLDIKSHMQRIGELENRRRQLTNEISDHKREIDGVQKQISPLEEEIKALTSTLVKQSSERDQALDASQHEISEIRAKEKELTSVQEEIMSYVKSKHSEMLEGCQRNLDQIDSKLRSLEVKRKEMNEQSQLIEKEISNQEVQTRDLKDTDQLRTKQKQTKTIGKEIEDLRGQLGGYNIETLHRNKKQLQKKEEELQAERHKAEGAQRELEESIRNLLDILTDGNYADADKKYMEKLIELKTTKLISRDIQKYSSALDGAIMQYHSLKMKEINKIVRDLWNKTYQGNDIDFIEIRSDVDEVANVTASGRRKQYRYRVVMIKGDVEQDMRGRCSAGQKVLASLIIRLALAETFCLNCGILALDEPTTNLDRENIDSLAEALATIVRSRSQQRNFQLIVITHDEDFLERLGRTEFVDYYFRVSKNEKCNSVVKKFHIQTLP